MLTGRKVLNEVMLLGAKVCWSSDLACSWKKMKLDVWISQPIGVHGFQALQTHRRTQSQKHTVLSDVTSSCPEGASTADKVRKRQRICQIISTVAFFSFFFFLSSGFFFFLLLCFPWSLCKSKTLFRKIYIINTVWQYKVRRKIVVKWARFCVSACVFHISLRF